ncbi:MAG: 3-methylitaconate isomerase [Proteobacteria bacterium]|nr:3-methylitaconate isomerase [Pseudomonadota bacterium]
MSALLSAITDKSTIHSVRCAIMRGGTSKAVIFAAADLPENPRSRDQLILAALGSPDPRQIDGLGGADPLTSKVAIVGRATRPDVDVDYCFGQVGIASATVNYAVSCGNTAAAVALYAIHERLVRVADGPARVRIHCVNNGKQIVATVSTTNGLPTGNRDARVPVVPSPDAQVSLEFIDPAGGDTGHLLPSGSPQDEMRTTRGTVVRFSLVDCGNLYAIIPADTWGLNGSEGPCELELVPGLRQEIEEIRESIAERYLQGGGRATTDTPRVARLKIAIVGSPQQDLSPTDATGACRAIDLVARIINPERVHKAFAVTGAMCLTAAASIPGTVVADLVRRPLTDGRGVFRIGHPSGVIASEIVHGFDSGRPTIHSIRIDRTARRIMDGNVFVSAGVLVP